MPFGQIILGAPGSGKSHYCSSLSNLFIKLNRPHLLINLDPANELLSPNDQDDQRSNEQHDVDRQQPSQESQFNQTKVPRQFANQYKPDITICDLITLGDVMSEFQLGPNGALMYCMEFLEKNITWLIQQIHDKYLFIPPNGPPSSDPADNKSTTTADEQPTSSQIEPIEKYLIFDLPGQIELFTHHMSLKSIVTKLTNPKGFDFRLTCVNLCDSLHLNTLESFLSICTMSLSTMCHIEIPFVHVFSKIDLLNKSQLSFDLSFYQEVTDLSFLLEHLKTKYESQGTLEHQQHRLAMTRELCDMIENYSLLKFHTLESNNKMSMFRMVQIIDKSNGFCYTQQEIPIETIPNDLSQQ